MRKSPRPRLASGERIHVDTDATRARPGLGAKAPVIRTGQKKEALPLRLGRSLFGWLMLAATIGVLVYTMLAATVMVVMRTDGHNVLVLRNAFPVGAAPSGVYAYVSSAPVDNTFIGHLTEATSGVPAGSVVRIVGGPFGDAATDAAGYVTINGKPTPYRARVTPVTLARQYIAICVIGACKPGSAVLVGEANIVGVVKGYVGANGLIAPSTPPAAKE